MSAATDLLKVLEMRVLYQHAKIVSGAYRFSNAQRRSPETPGGWRPLTDDEKLQDAMAAMKKHIEFMQKCIEPAGK